MILCLGKRTWLEGNVNRTAPRLYFGVHYYDGGDYYIVLSYVNHLIFLLFLVVTSAL